MLVIINCSYRLLYSIMIAESSYKNVVFQELHFVNFYYYCWTGSSTCLSLTFVAALYFTITSRAPHSMAIWIICENSCWITSNYSTVIFHFIDKFF